MSKLFVLARKKNYGYIVAILPPLLITLTPYPGFLGQSALRIVDLGIVTSLMIISVLLISISKGKICISKCGKKVFVILYLILLWELFVMLLSPTVTSVRDLFDLYKPVYYALAFLSGVLAARLIFPRTVMSLIKIILLVNAIIVVLQMVYNIPIVRYLFTHRLPELVDIHYSFRAIGTFGNPNHFGIVMVVLSSLFLYIGLKKLISSGKSRAGFVNIIWALLGIVAVLLSQSRTAFILIISSIVVQIVMTLFSTKIWCSFKRLINVFVIVIFIFLVSYIVVNQMMEQLKYLRSGIEVVLTEGLKEQSSFQGRLTYWKYYLEKFLEKPILGHGPSKDLVEYDVADNNYIFFAFKYGIVGLLILLMIPINIFIGVKAYFHRVQPDIRYLYVLVIIFWTNLLAASFTMEALESLRATPMAFWLTGYILSIGPNYTWVEKENMLATK